MESAFELCNNIESFSFNSDLDTSELISMKKAFSYCKKLESISFNKFDLSKVKDISYMLEGTGLYKFTPGIFDLNSVETKSSLFHSCHNLHKVIFSKTNSINLKNISYMFSGCINLDSLDISGINT